MRFYSINVVSVLIGVATLVGTAQAANYVMSGPAASLAPNSGAWGWDGANIAGYRAALGNAAYFGPGAPVTTSITTTSLSSITAGTLSGANGFIAPWWFNTDSAPYEALVVNFFKAGGSLFLLDDMSTQSGVATMLGIPTHDASDGSPSNGGPPLFSGPFGVAANVTQAGQHGFLLAAEITAHGGFVCSVNTSNQITAACFNAGAYAAGSGTMVITTDVDMISTASGGGTATYGPLDSNGIFALNATAFLLTNGAGGGGGAPTVPTLSDWALVGLALLLIASATLTIARGRART